MPERWKLVDYVYEGVKKIDRKLDFLGTTYIPAVGEVVSRRGRVWRVVGVERTKNAVMARYRIILRPDDAS